MRHLRRRLPHLPLLLLALIWLSACGTQDDPPADGVAFEPAATTAATTDTATTTAVLPATTQPPTGYPVASPEPTQTAVSYPAQPDDPTQLATAVASPAPSDAYPSADTYLPITAGSGPTPTATATITPAPTTTPASTATPTPIPTVDFAARRAELEANGQRLGTVKIGFHVTLLDERDLLNRWMEQLDAAGVPIFLKTVDNAEPLFRVQELMRESGVPHVLVYRATGGVPEYSLPPADAARVHWEFHRDRFPPELDPNLVWIETLNEVDRKQSEWLGQFALETARLALADGYRWAAFGFASGEPEPEQWQAPSMLEFLRLAGENPDRLAIALHEYSFTIEKMDDAYPFKVGRFQELFRIADQYGFPRPTVLITEFGWEYADIPAVDRAMQDLYWASDLYAPYPEVKGAAIWNLGIGCCYDDISDQVTQLVDPLTAYTLSKYYALSPDPLPIDPDRHAR